MTRAGGSVGRTGVFFPDNESALVADGGDKMDRETSRDPSRGQNFASTG